MLNAFYVSKDVDSVPVVEAAIGAIGKSIRRIEGRSPRLEQEDIGACVFGTQIDVAQDTGSNARLGTIEYQVGVHIDNGSFLV